MLDEGTGRLSKASAITHLVNSGAGLRTQMLRLHVQVLTHWAIQPPNDSKDVYVPGTVASVASVLHIKKWDTLTMVTTEIFPEDTWHWWIKHLWFGLFFMAPYVWVCVCAHTCVYVHARAHLFAWVCMCASHQKWESEGQDCRSSRGVMF